MAGTQAMAQAPSPGALSLRTAAMRMTIFRCCWAWTACLSWKCKAAASALEQETAV